MKKKLLSAILVTTMLFLSACNSTASSTTKANNEPGKPEAETSADSSETTKASENDKGAAPDSTGKYTYTVYAGTKFETTLSMNVNIDEYIIDKGQKVPFFKIGGISEDLGWYDNGDPNFDNKTAVVYKTYPYSNNTQMVWEYGDHYKDSNNQTGFPQFGTFIYHLAPKNDFNANARTKDEIKSSKKNYGINVIFGQHSADLCYYTISNGERVGISKNDAIIMAYVLSSAISKPGENPFFGTNLDNAIESVSDTHILYRLP